MVGGSRRVGLVTCAALLERDLDRELLRRALVEAGVEARWLVWSDAGVDWASWDLCVVRSTWDYYRAPEAFLAWVARAGSLTRLFNDPGIIAWNAHKGYLKEIEAMGVPTVPTFWVQAGQEARIEAAASALGAEALVIKPAVSAGSFQTRRFGPGEAAEAQAFLTALSAERDVMVQPYMASVDGHGERCLIWIDGKLTHAIRKTPRFSNDDERVSEAIEPTPQERAFASAALGEVAEGLLYARVDTVLDDTGQLRLAELELIEPSLFLRQHPEALDRLVAGIVRRLA